MRGKEFESAGEAFQERASRFIEELSVWYGEGELPAGISTYVQDGLVSMQKRFHRKGIQIRLMSKGRQEYQGYGQNKQSGETGFHERYCKIPCIREWTIERNGKAAFEKKEQNIIHIQKERKSQTGDEVVIDYYLERDITTDNNEVLNRIMQWVMLGMIFGLMYVLFFILISNQASRAMILTAPAVGGIIGYVVIALRMSGGLIKNAVRAVAKMKQEEEAQLQTVMVMENIPISFSYPAFEHRLLSLVQRVLLEEDISRFSGCEQEVMEGCIRDIVDAVWSGVIEYEGFHYEKPHCELKMRVHMIDTYVTGKNVFQRRDIFHVALYRNAEKEDEDWVIRNLWRDE